MRTRVTTIGIVLCLIYLPAAAQQTVHRFEHRIERTQSLDYLLALPDGYSDDGEAWPLVLFLHGAGERGADLEKLKAHGPPKLIAAGQDIPAIVVSPQCPEDEFWNGYTDTLLALVDSIEESYNVDPGRIYLTGLSMGGFGTWALAAQAPDRFAAAAPICGGGMLLSAYRIGSRLPVWAFHGDADPVVPVEESRRMVEAVKRRGGEAKLTIYPEVGHDSWTQTYEDREFWEWLFAQARSSE
jgi:predicted peptidase